MRRILSLLLLTVSLALAGTEEPITPQKSDQPPAPKLETVRRICVEEFEGGEDARHIRALLIEKLHRIKRFALTENPDRADAHLRGFAEDLLFREDYARSDAANARGSVRYSGGSVRDRTSLALSQGGSERRSERMTDRHREAAATVRLVSLDGDILWTATASSNDGKYKSASEQVAEALVKKLLKELPAETKAP
jgi:hypothetical protein